MSSVVTLNDADFDKNFRLKRKDLQGAVVVLFYRPSCPHCVTFKPNYWQAANKAPGGVKFAALNTEDNPATLQRLNASDAPFEVQGVPTVVSYDHGEYYSTYGPSNAEFRTPKDVLKFAGSIGHGDITYEH
jgi:thiol-disulfide isomerase/thioredoxin